MVSRNFRLVKKRRLITNDIENGLFKGIFGGGSTLYRIFRNYKTKREIAKCNFPFGLNRNNYVPASLSFLY